MYLEKVIQHLREGGKATRTSWDGYIQLETPSSSLFTGTLNFYRTDGVLLQKDCSLTNDDFLANDWFKVEDEK